MISQVSRTLRSPSQARIARDAYRDYGKGSGHKAALNFGDCFASALANEAGEPLLFKGDDFISTDIASALDAADARLIGATFYRRERPMA